MKCGSYKEGKVTIMADNKADETLSKVITLLSETKQTLLSTAVAAHERHMAFVQCILEHEIEALQHYTESRWVSNQELAEHFQKQTAPEAVASENRIYNPLKHEFSEAERQKMDRDIHLLSELARGVERVYQGRLALDFGWAVDALCDQRPTRVHHDMDARIILPVGVDQEQVFDFAVRVFAEQSNLRWYKRQTHPSWATIWGEDHARSSNPLEGSRADLNALHSLDPWAKPSQIEVISRQGHPYPMPLQRVRLTDTTGRVYHFLAPTPEALATTKLELLHSMRDQHEREFGETDVDDLRRLFARPSFDRGKVMGSLQLYWMNVHQMEADQALDAVARQLNALEV
jgi:hypothetical protein